MTEAPHQNAAHLTDLTLVLDSLPQGVLVVSVDGSVFYANMIAEQIFHASAAYLLRKGLRKILPTQSPVFQLVEQAVELGIAINEYKVPIATSGIRDDRLVDIHATPVSDSSGHVILTIRDRGVADRIESQLENKGIARSVTGLASMLGHEIKNPLSGIRGAAQLLEGVVSGDDKSLARLITSETDRIVKIVDRMEAFSNDTPPEIQAVNMHSVLGDVRRLAESGFASDIKISEDYDPSLPDVSGSRDELIQVFLNLVKNAAEAIGKKADGKIRLSSAYRPGIRLSTGSSKQKSLPLEFSVSDNANGIPDDIRAHVFEPFVTTKINGSGLGLAMVARIVERHGGIIECNSGPNGTVFSILLPAWTKVTSGGHDG